MIDPRVGRTFDASADVMFWLNVLALYLVSGLLIAAFFFEFRLEELPCPLCLLQRIALCGMAAGLVFNIRFGLNPRNYGLILLAAAAGGVFAVRQVLLHIAPGDPGYGTAFFGYHYYTWCAIVFAIAICSAVWCCCSTGSSTGPSRADRGRWRALAIAHRLVVTVANVATTFLECGLHACPDNPTSFELLDRPN